MLLLRIKAAMISSKPAWRWLHETHLFLCTLCRHHKWMGTAQEGEDGVVEAAAAVIGEAIVNISCSLPHLISRIKLS